MDPRPRDLIVMGPPGSGKSTLAAHLAERLGGVHVNPGTLFRELAAGESPAGDQLRALMAEGRHVPDDLTDALVGEQFAAVPEERSLVLEGYPRNAAQATALRRMLARSGRLEPRPLVLHLDVPRDRLLQRMARRRDLEGRGDDTDEVIARRLDLHDARTTPVVDAVRGWADVAHINGDQPVQAVAEDMIAALRR
jgi:adenylate kinase